MKTTRLLLALLACLLAVAACIADPMPTPNDDGDRHVEQVDAGAPGFAPDAGAADGGSGDGGTPGEPDGGDADAGEI